MQSEGEMNASKLTSVAMALSLWCQGHVGQSDDKVYSASEKHIVADIFVYTLALTGKGHFCACNYSTCTFTGNTYYAYDSVRVQAYACTC